jgi:hypothetical protein
MRRQISEELRATRTAFPRTERGDDAVRRSAWKMNRWKREGGVYDKKFRNTPPLILHNGCLPASIITAISVNRSTGFSKHLLYQELKLHTNDPKRTSPFGTRHLIRPLAPEGGALFSLGGINTEEGYIYLIPNSFILPSAKAPAGHSIIAGW